MIVVYDDTNNFIDTYINGILNSHSVTADVVDVTNYGPSPTVPFLVNRWGVEGDGASQWDDFKFFNTALTQQEVSHYYNLSLPPPPTSSISSTYLTNITLGFQIVL
jgi:hypothetical protein